MDNVFSCTCGCGLLRFEPDEDFIFVMYYPYAGMALTFWQRLKIVWGILRGNPNLIFDLVVKREDFFKVAAGLALTDLEDPIDRDPVNFGSLLDDLETANENATDDDNESEEK